MEVEEDALPYLRLDCLVSANKYCIQWHLSFIEGIGILDLPMHAYVSR